MKKVKQILMVAVTAVILINICACKNTENKVLTYPEIYDYFDSITLDTFQNKLNNKETFIVYVGRPTCSDCEILDDRLISDSKKNEDIKKILYLNISSIHDDKKNWENFKKNYMIEGTPAFISFNQGILASTCSWTEDDGFDYNAFIDWLNEVSN